MRDLTELAPDWATHYYVYDCGDILFECDSKCAIYDNERGLMSTAGDSMGVCLESMPIPKKSFDITKHEFSDKDIRLSNLCESKMELAVDDCGIEHYFTLHKDDAIAIAKALGVTGEDLM